MTEFDLSNISDDELRLLFNKPSAGREASVKAEINRRAGEYEKQANAAVDMGDIDLAIQKMDQAIFLKEVKEYKDKKVEFEKLLEKLDLLNGLETRLIQREDMKELKRAVDDGNKLHNVGKLPDELKEILETARKIEEEYRGRTGQVITNARIGNMVESREAYQTLCNNKNPQVWDHSSGYVDADSDAFKSLVSLAEHQWEKETNKVIENFMIDPDSSYSRLDEDPEGAEAALNRTFSPKGVDLVHPACAEKFGILKNEILSKADAYRTAERLYKESTTLANKVDAYEKVIEAFKRYKLVSEEEKKKVVADARKKAQNYTFRGLNGSAAQAGNLIDGFEFNSFKNLIEGVWKILNKLEMVQVQDATLKVNSEEIKNYTKRKEVYQKEFSILGERCEEAKKNYFRIDSSLQTFEKIIFSQDANKKVNAAETWDKFEKFLGEESAFLGTETQSKNYENYFNSRIVKLKDELIPLLGDQRQVDLMREGEDTPEKWPDILKTSLRLRRKNLEASEIYDRVFKEHNLVLLETAIKEDEFVTARKCLDDLVKHDPSMAEKLKVQEKKVEEAEKATTQEVEGFYGKASGLSESQEIADMVEAWMMLRHLTPEFYKAGVYPKWPVLSGKCKYAGQSRSRLVKIEAWLSGEAKRVSERGRTWAASISDHQDLSKEKKGGKSGKLEVDNALAKTARDARLLRENNFLSFEQSLDCKPLEIWDARQRADQHVMGKDFASARKIWQEMEVAYGREVENDVIRFSQNELLYILTDKLNHKDYQGAIDEVNRVERENMDVVSECYPIRFKHALAFEGLKQYDHALEKLDDIRPDLLHLDPEDIQVIEAERSRLKIVNEIHKGITAYKQAIKREEERYKNAPGYFIASLVHLTALKELREKHTGYKNIIEYFQEQAAFAVAELQRLINRNIDIPIEPVQRDVLLYRLCLRELKHRFAINLNTEGESLIIFGDEKKRNDSNSDKLNSVYQFINIQFDMVNPYCKNTGFQIEEAQRQAGSLSARDMADLMLGYHEQFKLLLTLENNFNTQTVKELKAKKGSALFMADKLGELCERADMEKSWAYTLRNGYMSFLWKAHFNDRLKNPDGETISKIKTRLAYIQTNFLNEKVVELDEFNNKLWDAGLLKPVIREKIDNIASKYSDYLTKADNSDWTVSRQVEEILFFETAVSMEVRKNLKHTKEEMQELYPEIITFYDEVIEYPSRDSEWAWKRFSGCKEKAIKIESNIKVWQDWSARIGFVESKDKTDKNKSASKAWQEWAKMGGRLRDYASAYGFAEWTGQMPVPWGNDAERMQQAAVVVTEKNWYLKVFEGTDKNNHVWEVDPPVGEQFKFKRYLLESPLPKTYQLWLWQSVLLSHRETSEAVEQGPEAKDESRLENYPATVLAAQKIKSRYQDILVELVDQKMEIEKIIKPLEAARQSFPPLRDLDNLLNNKQFDRLENMIKEAKLIGPQNRKEADYLWSKEVDLDRLKQNRGFLSSWFGKK